MIEVIKKFVVVLRGRNKDGQDGPVKGSYVGLTPDIFRSGASAPEPEPWIGDADVELSSSTKLRGVYYDNYRLKNGMRHYYDIGSCRNAERVTFQVARGEVGMCQRLEYDYEGSEFSEAFPSYEKFEAFAGDDVGCCDVIVNFGGVRFFASGNRVMLNATYPESIRQEVAGLIGFTVA